MTKDEELEQLRAEKKALCELLQRKDEELEQSRKANQDVREGLKQAIKAIESLQGHVKTLDGLDRASVGSAATTSLHALSHKPGSRFDSKTVTSEYTWMNTTEQKYARTRA